MNDAVGIVYMLCAAIFSGGGLGYVYCLHNHAGGAFRASAKLRGRAATIRRLNAECIALRRRHRAVLAAVVRELTPRQPPE